MFRVLAVTAILAAGFSTSQAFAASDATSMALAKSIYTSSSVLPVVEAAKKLRGVGADVEERPVLISEPDCSNNPKPFGRANTNLCAIEIRTAYGWYADPVLVINVKGFINKAKIKAATVNADEISIREISAVVPDPTGLE